MSGNALRAAEPCCEMSISGGSSSGSNEGAAKSGRVVFFLDVVEDDASCGGLDWEEPPTAEDDAGFGKAV